VKSKHHNELAQKVQQYVKWKKQKAGERVCQDDKNGKANDLNYYKIINFVYSI
jgi:hypothetical protein